MRRRLVLPSGLPRLPALLLVLALLLAARLQQPNLIAAPAAANTAPPPGPADLDPLTAGLSTITTNDLLHHTRTLASDAFGGRAPGSPGEELTVQYLAREFQRIGLEPGNPDGSWFQTVPLVGIRSQVSALVARGDTREAWQFPQDYVAWSPRMTPKVAVTDSELVFVGYGVVAPEYAWDDFKDVDVRGKTVVMLVNDPQVPDPQDPSRLDDSVFRGRAMTYYGRWTYKYEIAAARGAAAALIVHETGPAGYPYFVVINSWGRENFDLESDNANADRLAVCSWISLDRARRLFTEAGTDLETLRRSALRRDFRPVPLGARITFEADNTLRAVRSRNVLGRLPGAHPERRNEYVVLTSHWDHLGSDDRLDGDRIFNGALDNAVGTAALLEIAQAAAALPRRPDRTLLFLSVTAEEQGLLGARYYAQHPPYPLHRTLANLNMDTANVLGRRRDVGVVGFGQNTLEDLLADAARTQGRTVRAEEEPEKGGYFRSDHFEFAKVGVPALYLDTSSTDILGHPPGYGKQRRDEYRDQHYHKPGDEIKPWWDLAGAVEDAQLLLRLAVELGSTSRWPEWKTGSEFRARRLESLAHP